MKILPRLGRKYNLEIETISRSREAYQQLKHLDSDLPAAPAVILGNELLIQGCLISQEEIESSIRRHLGIF
jgi:hypothetical protein